MPTRKMDADEGLGLSFLIRCAAALHGDILPIQLRPPAHKPNFIRLLEPRLVGHTFTRR
jgi:hypothetical protein